MTSVRFPEILRIILESPWQPFGLIAVQWTEVKSKYFLRFLLAVIVHFFFVFRFLMCSDALLCLTLCDSKDCSLPGSFVHGVFQARVLEWGAIAFSKGMTTTPVFSPGEFYRQRSLTGYSPWDHKELDMTEWLSPGNSRAELGPYKFCKNRCSEPRGWVKKIIMFQLDWRKDMPSKEQWTNYQAQGDQLTTALETNQECQKEILRRPPTS